MRCRVFQQASRLARPPVSEKPAPATNSPTGIGRPGERPDPIEGRRRGRPTRPSPSPSPASHSLMSQSVVGRCQLLEKRLRGFRRAHKLPQHEHPRAVISHLVGSRPPRDKRREPPQNAESACSTRVAPDFCRPLREMAWIRSGESLPLGFECSARCLPRRRPPGGRSGW